MNQLSVESVPLSEMKPHPKNPRVHPEAQLAKVVRSMEEYGWTNPILLSKDGFILAGHGRYEAARRMGLDEVPVIRLELEGDEALAYMVADNKIAAESMWVLPQLREILVALDTGNIDMEITGFELKEIENLMTMEGRTFATSAQVNREAKVNEELSAVEATCPGCGKSFSLTVEEILGRKE